MYRRNQPLAVIPDCGKKTSNGSVYGYLWTRPLQIAHWYTEKKSWLSASVEREINPADGGGRFMEEQDLARPDTNARIIIEM
jgi:hypothetical protein